MIEKATCLGCSRNDYVGCVEVCGFGCYVQIVYQSVDTLECFVRFEE